MSGRRILIVEDEPLIAMLLEDYLELLGETLSGVADCVADALAIIARGPLDMAIIDVNLRNGEKSWPIADALAEAGVPFVFASGGGDVIPGDHARRPVLAKPFTMADVEQLLGSIG